MLASFQAKLNKDLASKLEAFQDEASAGFCTLAQEVTGKISSRVAVTESEIESHLKLSTVEW